MARRSNPLTMSFTNSRAGARVGSASKARAPWRPALAGLLLGALAGLFALAPAQWLADAVDASTQGRVQLLQPQGRWWSGDAWLRWSAGQGGRDAVVLPDRLHWQLRPAWLGLDVTLRQPCCMPGDKPLQWRASLGSMSLELPTQTWFQGSAAWLTGLGTPMNTLKPEGLLRLSTQDLRLRWAEGRLQVQGSAEVVLQDLSSAVSTLDRLGSYQLQLRGGPQGEGELSALTLSGPLQINASGQWLNRGGLRLRGEATAQPGQETALDNLLNLLGKRQGARALLSIG
jgi:general secretion pathway protein N